MHIHEKRHSFLPNHMVQDREHANYVPTQERTNSSKKVINLIFGKGTRCFILLDKIQPFKDTVIILRLSMFTTGTTKRRKVEEDEIDTRVDEILEAGILILLGIVLQAVIGGVLITGMKGKREKGKISVKIILAFFYPVMKIHF